VCNDVVGSNTVNLATLPFRITADQDPWPPLCNDCSYRWGAIPCSSPPMRRQVVDAVLGRVRKKSAVVVDTKPQ
jgi:hypothetical protein